MEESLSGIEAGHSEFCIPVPGLLQRCHAFRARVLECWQRWRTTFLNSYFPVLQKPTQVLIMADFISRHLLCAWHSVYLGTLGWKSMMGSLHSSVHWLHLETVLDKTANGQVAQRPTFMSLVPGLQAAISQKYCPAKVHGSFGFLHVHSTYPYSHIIHTHNKQLWELSSFSQ